MKKLLPLLVLLICVFHAKGQAKSYKSKELGWKIEIPEGYEVESKEEMRENYERGEEMLEESLGGKIVGEVYDLVDFKKDDFNRFQSVYQLFEPENGETYEEWNQVIKDAMLATFTDQGINCEMSELRFEKINNLEAYTYSITIFSYNSDVIMQMLTFNILIGKYDAAFTIFYNNEADKDKLLSVFKASTFE